MTNSCKTTPCKWNFEICFEFYRRNFNYFISKLLWKLEILIVLGQCFNYKNLTESWRKIRKIDSSGSHHSDKWGYWDGWYRFVEPAGTKLANKDIGYEACDRNSASGWLDGPDPTEVGKTIQERICFSGYSKYMTDVLRPCAHVEWIHVTLCKDSNDENFLVYQLKGPPEYASVYCAEWKKLKIERKMKLLIGLKLDFNVTINHNSWLLYK